MKKKIFDIVTSVLIIFAVQYALSACMKYEMFTSSFLIFLTAYIVFSIINQFLLKK